MGLLDLFFYNKTQTEPIQKKALSKASPIMIGAGGVQWYTDNPTQYIQNGYTTNPIVYSIVKQISDKIAAVPFYLYEVKKDKQKDFKRYKSFNLSNNLLNLEAFTAKSTSLEEVDNHVMMRMLDQPNDNQGWSDFVKDVVGYKLVCGNTFILGGKPLVGKNSDKIVSLTCMPAPLMNIVTNNYGVEYYNISGTNQRYEKDEILHLKYWNPTTSTNINPYGQSPLRAGLQVMTLNNEAYKAQSQILANRGAYGMLTAKDSDASEDQFNQLKNKFKNAESGEIMIVASELVWTQFGQPSDELQILQSMDINLRDLCNIYSFPSLLLGNTQDKTYSNYAEASKQMVLNTCVPLLTELRDNLNKWLVAPYSKAEGREYYIDFDISVLPDLAQNMAELIGQLKDQPYLTMNEKRAACKYGVLNDPLMDQIYIPNNMMALGDIGITLNTDPNDQTDYQ